MAKNYYSVRTGKVEVNKELSLEMTLRLFRTFYLELEENGYFQESFGYECVDAGYVSGLLGADVEAKVFYALKKDSLFPISENCLEYSEDDLFDIVEFLYDNVSAPLPQDDDIDYHSWNNCGYHYKYFDRKKGKDKLRKNINSVLLNYDGGYELSLEGELFTLPENGLESLITAEVPPNDASIEAKMNRAISRFRLSKSSWEDRKDAVRELADILEHLRPIAKKNLIKKDESDLFEIANKFGIRHHNHSQKTDYDKKIFLTWLFYYYLATIHALLRIVKKNEIDVI